MNNRKIDLHMHSTNSDGEQPPEKVIHEAEAARLSLISITDHNMFTFLKSEKIGNVVVVPGVEFSAEYLVPAWNETTEIHIIGIFPSGVAPSDFDDILACIGDGKEDYVRAILDDLESRGIHITMQEVIDVPRKGKHLGRHEIAKVLVSKGIESDIDAAFDHQIGNFSPYYIPSTRYIHYATMEDVVKRIIKCAGIPVLAHPYGYSLNEEEIEQLISDFKECATYDEKPDLILESSFPMGMEIFYERYLSDDSRVEFLKRMQKKYNLLASAGSDRHRENQPFCSEGDYDLFKIMLQTLNMEEQSAKFII